MAELTYEWKRFWCPRTKSINLSDGGFLFDPDSEYGKYLNADLVQLEDIFDQHCIVLLGEPGMGKSSFLENNKTNIEQTIHLHDGKLIWRDLRSFGNESRLIDELFRSNIIDSWKKGNYPLYMFLDSLDESLLRIDTISSIIAEEIKDLPTERLFIRIACRTADWPFTLEENLYKIWDHSSINILELTPLRKIDVLHAAEANDLGSKSFFEELDRVGVVPLAIKPLTLKFLLNIFKKECKFPDNQQELYFKGCSVLCSETNPTRLESWYNGKLSSQERLLLASKIAAIMIFSNKYAVWTSTNFGDMPEEDISVQELAIINVIHENLIREAISTGLFSSRGPNRMGWAHQTYAEYLAAFCLIQNNVTPHQILALIKHPDDDEGKLIPQLSETSAWLAGMNNEVFDGIMDTDPDILLRSGISSADNQSKAQLLDRLLNAFRQERLLDIDVSMRSGYKLLAYPNMEMQLLPIIKDKKSGIIARRAAIDIAEDCNLFDLQDDLVNLVLDRTEEYQIRVQAACAISKIGNAAVKAKLIPLLDCETDEDPDDELKGFALKSVWPGLITSEQLFLSLKEPKRSMFFGAYSSFLSSDLIKNLQEDDYLIALQWVENQESNHDFRHNFENIISAIMIRAFYLLNDCQSFNAYGKTLISIIEHHDVQEIEYDGQSLKTLLLQNSFKRQELVKSMFPIVSKDNIWLFHFTVPLINNDDLVWLIDELKNSTDEKDQDKWANLIEIVRDPSLIDHTEIIYSAIQQNNVVKKYFEHLFDPIQLESIEAENLRNSYLRRQQFSKSHEKPLLDPPPVKRVLTLLEYFEAGRIEAWWQLNLEMTLEPNSTHYRNEIESDLTSLPGWANADMQTQARLIDAAKEYLHKADPQPDRWLGTNNIHRPAFAGYRALRLVQKEDPAYLLTLNGPVWEKWASIILAYPVTINKTEDNPHLFLVKNAYISAPEQILSILKILIMYENSSSEHISIVDKMELCWDDKIANTLMDLIHDVDLKPTCLGDLLHDLLAHNIKEARNYIYDLIQSPVAFEESHLEKTIITAACLIIDMNYPEWNLIWPIIITDTDFAKKLMYRLASKYDYRPIPFINMLDEIQIADFYIWLENNFPKAEDPKHDNDEIGHCVTPRESVAEFKNSLITVLKTRGTLASCEALTRILHEFPHMQYIKWIIIEAKHNTRRHLWAPLRPDEIMLIIKDKQKQLVQNGKDLLVIILESLSRLEQKFQGQTPAAIDVWNKVEGKYTPMDENAFSNRVKRHLEEDLKDNGIVANREVEIRRGEGSGKGERTDIQVNAVTRDKLGQLDILTAIIEVKGCWHSELLVDMKDQLVDRYLKDNLCRNGLYLVGWFRCKQWDSNDERYKKSQQYDFENLINDLNNQADELSQNGLVIKSIVLNASLR